MLILVLLTHCYIDSHNWGTRVQFPVGTTIFLFPIMFILALGPNQPTIQLVSSSAFLGVRKQALEAEHSSTSSARVTPPPLPHTISKTFYITNKKSPSLSTHQQHTQFILNYFKQLFFTHMPFFKFNYLVLIFATTEVPI
jgi:hypothetical protein